MKNRRHYIIKDIFHRLNDEWFQGLVEIPPVFIEKLIRTALHLLATSIE